MIRAAHRDVADGFMNEQVIIDTPERPQDKAPAAAPLRPGGTRVARRRRRRRWLAALLVLAGAGGGVYYWQQQGSAAPQSDLIPVAVTRGDVEDLVSALGNLQPRDYVDVGTQVSGQLKEIHVQIGDEVKAGDLVAEIDPVVLNAKVEAGRAQLASLRAQLADKESAQTLAGLQLQRQARLRKDNATSEEAYQSAEAASRSAAAQVDMLKAQIRQTESTLKGDEATLGYTKIYAPMAGTVVSLTGRKGQTLNANQSAPIILRVADLSVMTVQTQVSEADIPKLRLGMDVYFNTLGSPERRWTGKLQQILPTPEIVNNVVLYTALFDVDNPRGELMTQMSAQVFFVVASAKDVVTAPLAALRPVRGGRGAAPSGDAARAERRAARQAAGAGDAATRIPSGRRRPVEAANLGPRPGQRFIATVIGKDGTRSEREVRIGVTNRVTAEIVSGLEAGETIGQPALSAATQGQQSGARRFRPGFRL